MELSAEYTSTLKFTLSKKQIPGQKNCTRELVGDCAASAGEGEPQDWAEGEMGPLKPKLQPVPLGARVVLQLRCILGAGIPRQGCPAWRELLLLRCAGWTETRQRGWNHGNSQAPGRPNGPGDAKPGHLNSHRNVGIRQASCQGSGHWAWALEPGPGRPSSSSQCREMAKGPVDKGSVYSDTCCFHGKALKAAAGGMPGLLNQVTGAALPLTASDVTSFVSGYALGLTASLTYGNLEVQPFQGKARPGLPGPPHALATGARSRSWLGWGSCPLAVPLLSWCHPESGGLLTPSSCSRVSPCSRRTKASVPSQEGHAGGPGHPMDAGPAPTGLFVYPLDEYTTVIGFEAVIANRVVTVQIKDKAKLESGHADPSRARATTATGNILPEGAAITTHSCTPGQVALDEDLERILFVVNLGTIAPMENVTVFVSTSSELPTLPSGAVRVLLPAVCAPIVPHFLTKHAGSSSQQTQGKDKHCFGTRALDSWNKLCLATFLNTDVSNPMEYEFNFQLEIRGPCLLAGGRAGPRTAQAGKRFGPDAVRAPDCPRSPNPPCLPAPGVESPTHEIRADAAPSAPSAKSVIVTLANKHTFDRPVEILIHPSEPHMPHVLMEKGDMTLGEFEQHLKGRTDFIRGMRKDSSAERKTEIIRKRLHKDIPHHSVIMLNFCPDLQSVQPNLRKTQGEFIFLIDRSSSMNGTNIHHVKDAMLVALKSLMPVCLFNVIGFGSTFKALFPSSQTYSEESLALACNNIQRMRADMGGTNILSPLKWIIRQPVHPGHPRLLFLITDGAVNNTGKVLELLRNHAFSTRCYSFGIGSSVCHRLVKGLATVSKGSAEFLREGERLQPKMVKSLKKAMAPVLSDVTVEWVFPETTEVLISPVSASSLFPGERLVGYGIVCDASSYISSPKSDKKQRYHMLHSQESSSSVFYHSQEEGPSPDSGDCAGEGRLGTPLNPKQAKGARPSSGDSASNSGLELSQRRRAYSTNQITNHKPFPRTPTTSDPTMAARRYPLRKAKLQDLTNQASADAPRWQIDLQPLLNSGHDLSQGPKLRGPGARRPSLLPQGCQPILPSSQETQDWGAMKEQTFGSYVKPASDSRSPGDTGKCRGALRWAAIPLPAEPPHHPSSFETKISDPEPPAEAEPERERSPSRPSTPVLGKAVVTGLRDSQRLQWEVSFELELPGPEPRGKRPLDLWSETFHHLAARAIIRDFEQLAERQSEIEQGSSRRYQVSAMHTSKACNVISKYTAFVPVDVSKRRYLPTVVRLPNSGPALRTASNQGLARGWRSSCTGFGRSQTMHGEDSAAGDDKCQSLSKRRLGRVLKPGPLRESALMPETSLPTRPLNQHSEPWGPGPGQGRCGDPGLLSGPPSGTVNSNLSRGGTGGEKGGLGAQASPASSVVDVEQSPSEPTSLGREKYEKYTAEGPLRGMATNTLSSLKTSDSLFGSRLNLNTSRLLTRAAKGLLGKPPAKAPEPTQGSQSFDYIPLVCLQLASGAFLLNQAFCDAVQIPMEKLRWTSPFTCHRVSLATRQAESKTASPQLYSGHSARHPFYDGFSSEPLAEGRSDWEARAAAEHTGKLWATVVALAWLEHSSAPYFVEWELVAAKASSWLEQQEVPEGRTRATLKASARQLFVLLRHWDETLEFNMLCYNPSYM
ncbi:von Willebrand factor A domain-containing protein 5B1 [Galemys pyrenaicus]|uniref:von Willebrand factor A domain-containing protein 5B1 n=1 Tax=Galemys pyrenaicus TaxID=202257 RepID=A0A8J5ZUM2_GALPY|nr:von Willebrand factor A domain-containing protein 5B1 [Galemys pyrenaicus]